MDIIEDNVLVGTSYHMKESLRPSPSTVRYTDLGALASGPYSVRTAPSSRVPSILLTEVPVTSAESAAYRKDGHGACLRLVTGTSRDRL